MHEETSASPRKATAAQANGLKGGTKNPTRSRWNAFRHGLNAKKLTIAEGRHLPDYAKYASMRAELLESLGPLPVEDLIAVDKLIADAWRLARAQRFEFSETEKAGNGMCSDGMANVLRFLNLADRQFRESYERVKALRAKKQAAAAAQRSRAAASGSDGAELGCEQTFAAASSDSESVHQESLNTAPPDDASEGPELTSSTPTPSSSSSGAGTGASRPPESLERSVAGQQQEESAAGYDGEKASTKEAEGKTDLRGEGGGAE